MNLSLLQEKDGARGQAFPFLCEAVKHHLIGAEILERLNFSDAAEAIRGRIPTEKKTRSGDLAEILATDYVNEWGPFMVPLNRLRYKDDRDLPMRGDDIIGLDLSAAPPRILKAEVKSRESLSQSVVEQACNSLDANEGRPKPASLSFTSMRLREQNKEDLAKIVEQLQNSDVDASRMTHLVFTLSGNNPSEALRVHAIARGAVADRRFVGFVIGDHQDFIKKVFEAVSA